jgi:NAD(P)-dependent dehydrogenase (short-subunit alcohol dehydrogenase family)
MSDRHTIPPRSSNKRLRHTDGRNEAAGSDTPENRARFLATILLGRLSMPEDLGNAAAFLCSDEASMITGVAMEVDGGRCIEQARRGGSAD